MPKPLTSRELMNVRKQLVKSWEIYHKEFKRANETDQSKVPLVSRKFYKLPGLNGAKNYVLTRDPKSLELMARYAQLVEDMLG